MRVKQGEILPIYDLPAELLPPADLAAKKDITAQKPLAFADLLASGPKKSFPEDLSSPSPAIPVVQGDRSSGVAQTPCLSGALCSAATSPGLWKQRNPLP